MSGYGSPEKTEITVTIKRHRSSAGLHLDLLHVGRGSGVSAKSTGADLDSLAYFIRRQLDRHIVSLAENEALPDDDEYKSARVYNMGRQVRRGRALLALIEAYQELAIPLDQEHSWSSPYVTSTEETTV